MTVGPYEQDAHLMATRKRKEREGRRKRKRRERETRMDKIYPSKAHSLVTYFLHLDPTSQ
jgi:hypothetical protein